MCLTKVGVGKIVRILGISGGREMQSRLASLGLLPGVRVEVLSAAANGPLLLLVRQARVALGRGMASMILVG